MVSIEVNQTSMMLTIKSGTATKKKKKVEGVSETKCRKIETDQKIRSERKLAVISCVLCSNTEEPCWEDSTSGKCACCAENERSIGQCLVDPT